MKILVVEDNEQHRNAAIEELTAAGHEVTAVTKRPYSDYGFVSQGFSSLPGEYIDSDDRENFWSNPSRSKFDAALFDLFLPEEKAEGLDGADPSKEQPYGLIMAFRAVQCGVKYIGVITDANHHRNAISNALDMICPPYWWSGMHQPVFRIGESILGIAHTETTGEKRWLAMLEHLVSHDRK